MSKDKKIQRGISNNEKLQNNKNQIGFKIIRNAHRITPKNNNV